MIQGMKRSLKAGELTLVQDELKTKKVRRFRGLCELCEESGQILTNTKIRTRKRINGKKMYAEEKGSFFFQLGKIFHELND